MALQRIHVADSRHGRSPDSRPGWYAKAVSRIGGPGHEPPTRHGSRDRNVPTVPTRYADVACTAASTIAAQALRVGVRVVVPPGYPAAIEERRRSSA